MNIGLLLQRWLCCNHKQLKAMQVSHPLHNAICITQAIRDAFSLDITLYDIQNQERARVMFNQDVSCDRGGGLGIVL